MHKEQSQRVLVVGTTSDYIDWIRNACPNRALFLTDPAIRQNAKEKPPSEKEELLTPLDDSNGVRLALNRHMKQWNLEISGVACFDCESMELASLFAADLGLSYPSIEAIRTSRNKLLSKQIWQEIGLPCPKTEAIQTSGEVKRFLSTVENGLVLKPVYGSGSQLVFHCRSQQECDQAFQTIKTGLEKIGPNLLFGSFIEHNPLMVAEEFIPGIEYSSDVIIENDAITMIRIARKIKLNDMPLGTIAGYVLPSDLPLHISRSELERIVLQGARSIGIRRGICMVDFIVHDSRPVLIEMTPRPGGDCLPFLLQKAGDLDILRLTLDFAEKKELLHDFPLSFKPHLGIRIHARRDGILKRIDLQRLLGKEQVKDCRILRESGHVITMPPNDYDSWYLGHLILPLERHSSPESECRSILHNLKVEMEPS